MPLLNYSTTVSARKTAFEIQDLLSRAKAVAVLMENDEQGVLESISFKIRTANCGILAFRLPANVQKVYQVLVRQSIPKRMKTREQAANVAWRIVKEWLAAQLAFIESAQVDAEQVFLPYAQTADGSTLYESLAAVGFSTLALPDKPKETPHGQ